MRLAKDDGKGQVKIGTFPKKYSKNYSLLSSASSELSSFPQWSFIVATTLKRRGLKG